MAFLALCTTTCELALDQQRNGALFDRGFGEGVAVKQLPDDAAEHAAGRYLSRIVFDGLDVNVFAGVAQPGRHGKLG